MHCNTFLNTEWKSRTGQAFLQEQYSECRCDLTWKKAFLQLQQKNFRGKALQASFCGSSKAPVMKEGLQRYFMVRGIQSRLQSGLQMQRLITGSQRLNS